MEKYIVSARKYRPVNFESVVGQSHITSTLRNAIMRNQLAHAYLFCGPRGVGKTTCARILAKAINCMNPASNAEACNECESCRAFNEGRSYNIHELDAASNNSVEYIRTLTEQVRIPPQVGKYSVYIIDEAHMLSATAFNAFLKTLEEPPAHAVFILATTEKHKIIPTILSRCQIYDFRRIKTEDVVGYLKHISVSENVRTDDESLHIIAQKADGCMRDALSMYDKVVSFCGGDLNFRATAEALNVLDYDTYFQFTDSLAAGDYASALVAYDQVLQKGFDSQTFLSGLGSHLRNLLVALSGNTRSLLEVTGSVADRYIAQAKSLQVPFLYDGLNIIARTETALRQTSNLRLHTELAILKLCNLSPVKLSSGDAGRSYDLPPVSGTAVPSGTAAASERPANRVVPQPVPTREKTGRSAAPAAESVPSAAPSVMPSAAVAAKEAVHPEEKTAVVLQEPPVVPKQPARSVGSRLGLSIGGLLQQQQQAAQPAEEERETAGTVSIAESDREKVLEGCRNFAQELAETRPRLVTPFQKAKIVDGKIELVVANAILSDEILNNKHELLTRLERLCGVPKLDVSVIVDKNAEEVKSAPVRDEDKFKVLLSVNPKVSALCSAFDLDFT